MRCSIACEMIQVSTHTHTFQVLASALFIFHLVTSIPLAHLSFLVPSARLEGVSALTCVASTMMTIIYICVCVVCFPRMCPRVLAILLLLLLMTMTHQGNDDRGGTGIFTILLFAAVQVIPQREIHTTISRMLTSLILNIKTNIYWTAFTHLFMVTR